MTTRNFDSSDLTRLTRDRTQFSFFSQRTTAQAEAKDGVYVRGINPQTGITAQSSVNNLINGDYTTYYRAFPDTVISVPYNTLNSVNNTNSNNTSRDLTGQTYIMGFLIHNGAYSNPIGPVNWWIDSVFGTILPFTFSAASGEAIQYTTAGGFPYNGVFAYLQALQAAGAKVLISLGGSSFTVSDISNTTVATQLAQSICYSMLGQTSSPNPLNWYALTTDAGAPFAFDGVDFDFENPAVADKTVMTALLSTTRSNAPYKLITCAPQPPYLFNPTGFPSGFNANGAYQAYTSESATITTLNGSTGGSPALLDVNNIGNFSQINMQYYNQSPDQYPGGANFTNILAQLGYLCLSATTTNKPLVNIGLLVDTNGGSSPIPIPDVSSIAPDIVSGVLAAQALILAARPGTALNQWLNGLMFWESPLANDYATALVAAIQAINTSIPVNVVLYGGQNWASPGILNPGWTTSNTPPPGPSPPPGPNPNTYTIQLGTPDPSGVPNNATVNINLVFTGSFSYSTIVNQILFNTGTPTPSVSPSLQSFVNTTLSTNLNNGFFNSNSPTLTPSGSNTILNVSFNLVNYTSVTPAQLIGALLQLPTTFGTTGYTLVYGSSNIVISYP
uniref:Uncharacterized protein n=1 Tax=viral metagenome TaxID=1070528 RepID=A0A6C0AQL1_9ZZZZ